MQKPSQSRKDWLGKLAGRYHAALTPETLGYLESRGLSRDAVSGFRLGLVTDPDPMHEPYAGRLAIPFITPTGVVYMRFRCLEDHAEFKCSDFGHGKYEGPSGEGTHLYNVSALHSARSVVGVCEGELDAIVATSAGVPAVGVPGSQNWKPFYYRLFVDFEEVLILGDGDTAGRAFTAKLSPNIPGAVARVMPADYDVSSYVVEHGVEAFRELIGAPSMQP